ncbi:MULTISPECIES: VWA domain-containing protein [unclassified Amycolatopsis]|uniref:vWA domain-containing protein n=1 Tax=unclassified Amycolatopsis TaxID=2618356 RepID=UPI0028743914|nr:MULTISPECIES: VWA domain-containing protein [unclassified Amycolatopsis]MDS0132733.1 VWA domain-containing protein [Amycolatopsis sp. 505]MDS0142442.1 VWA domain-containing protein [Amycolatopsis sp. CM201R]
MTQVSSETVSDTSASDGQMIMPFYLIVDVSSSMSGDIGELRTALDDMVQAILEDPVVDDLVMLGIITFNHTATTVVPLCPPSEVNVPALQASGGTSYGAAFHEFKRAFDADRARLKGQGMRVYRPCVFFLTDGAPGDRDHLTTFRSLFAYDPESGTGNKAFPYFVPFGFRDAPEDVIRALAYPNFGKTKGRWFLSRSSNVREILRAMTEVIGQTALSSGQSVAAGAPQIVTPQPAQGMDTQFGDAGDWM